ncbi:MAG: hypothetical protein ACXU82_09555 [Caulobacteraceae bacterium]
MSIAAVPPDTALARESIGRLWRQLAAWAPFVAVAAYLIGQLSQGGSILYTGESYGYVAGGLIMAAGHDVTGQISDRNIGYPLLSALLTPHGGFRALVVAQAFLAAGGLVALLVVLRAFAQNVFVFAVAGLLAVLMAVSSNAFPLNAQTINAESPFAAFLALALMFLVLASSRDGRSRLWLLLGATASAYVCLLFKPNALLVLPLCGGALVVALVAAPLRTLNWRLIAAAALFAVATMSIGSLQHRAQRADWDFGPRMLFCSHLDQEVVGLPATPEGVRLKAVLQNIKAAGATGGYPLLGYNPDDCFYPVEPREAVHAAAAAAHMTDRDWMQHQFIRSIVRHPLTYARQILRQYRGFFANPDGEANIIGHSRVADIDPPRLAPYAALIGAPLTTLNGDVDSWFARELPPLAQFGKAWLGLADEALMGAILVATLVALRNLVIRRRMTTLERAFLAFTLFMLANITSVSAAYTFDAPRFASAFAQLTIVWLLAALLFIFKSMATPKRETPA